MSLTGECVWSNTRLLGLTDGFEDEIRTFGFEDDDGPSRSKNSSRGKKFNKHKVCLMNYCTISNYLRLQEMIELTILKFYPCVVCQNHVLFSFWLQ